MNQAPIRQRRMDNKQRNSDKTAINLELPKLSSKVEEANSFLANPLQLSKASEIQGESSELVNLMKQPWFDSGDETPAVKQQKAIKLQIANILGGGTGEDTQASAARQAEQLSPQRIISKMKKYQPTNSSFSLLYGEKKTIQQHSNRPEMLSTLKRRKILNLPALNLRGQSTHSRVQLQQHINQLYSQRQARSPSSSKPQKFTNYINKIKQIYNQGNALHHKSQTLIHRIDKVSAFLGHKFDRFDQQSHNMLADVGTYHLQEETSGEYKKMMMEGLSRRLRK